jgi:O-antigen/teichoic acid export membrane protein
MPLFRNSRRSPGRPAAQHGRASFRESFSFGALSFVVGALLGVVSSIAIARAYGIEVIGEYALASAPMGMVWFLSTVSERPALVRALAAHPPRAPEVTGLVAAVYVFSAGLTALVACLAAGATYLLFNGPIEQPDLFGPALVILAGYLLVTNTCWNLDTALIAFRAGRQLFWIRLDQAAVYLVVAVATSFVLSSVWGLVVAYLASWIVSLVHRLVSARRWVRARVPLAEVRRGFRTLPEILIFGLKIAPGSVAQGLSAQAGTWILGILSPVAVVGAWNRAWMLGQRLIELNYRIVETLFPTLVERQAAGDRSGFERALVDSLRYVATGLFLPAAVGGGAAVGIMNLFGPGFSRAADALALILLVPPLATMIRVQQQALFAVDRPLLTSGLAIARMITTVSTSIAFTLWLGVTGTALGVVTGCVVQLALQATVTRRHLARPIRQLWPYRQAAALVVAYAAGFLASRGLDSSITGLLGLTAGLTAGSAAYIGCFLILGGILPRDRERVTAVARGLARRDRTTAPSPAS